LGNAIACGLAGAALVFAVSACSVLPSSGPLSGEIIQQDGIDDNAEGYVLIDIDAKVTAIQAAQPRDSFSRVFADKAPAPDLRIGIGDSVIVTVYEAGPGLFSASLADKSVTAGSRTAVIPEQVVARDGTIQVPYAGRVHVNGLRPAQVEAEIVKALDGKANQPQAVVTIARNVSNTVTVSGEVTGGALVPLNPKGQRVLDVIAAAGGLKSPASETFIRLTRHNRTASLAYNAILSNPQENIFVRPGDIVTVVREPPTFTAFGSTGRNATVPFETATLTMEEAIAKAGGLLDSRADPAGVFLLRFEPVGLVRQLSPERQLPVSGDLVPVIYKLNLREAQSFFLARAFAMKDKDILYVSNAPSDPLRKFLGMVGQLTAPVAAGAAVYYNVNRANP
jgi:polysaccharide export outer membrane protein